MTLKNNVAKAKQFYNFNQNEKRVPAIVELVLSGSRYKVRLLTQQTYIIFALQGVRTFPNDTNVKSYAENSAKALLFSKENLLQRDVELEFESFDNNGAICGSITLNKKNYAVSLLEAGLAFASKGGPKITSRYQDQYERAEADAKKNEIGIWANGQSLNLSTSRIGFKELKEKATLVCSEISSEETFYLQDTANKVLISFCNIN